LQARYTQGPLGFAPLTSKSLVNSRSNKVVNIRSTKMMKKFLGGTGMESPALPFSAILVAVRP
jgi:hypothetical protein